MTRRGFTLVELLVTLAVLGILGGALARITISQSRYVGEQEALMEARQTARQAMMLLTNEMRGITDNGVIAASADSVRLSIPVAFGVLCATAGPVRYASLLPYDSVQWANAAETIVMRRWGSSYTFGTAVTVATAGTSAACDADSIRTVPGGRMVTLAPISATAGATPGDIFYLYERITYSFANSTSMPGRRGLFRRATGRPVEELLAPFATGARFAFLTGSRLTTTTTAPADLRDIMGLELRLITESSATPSGRTTPMTYDLRPRIRFGNMSLD